MCLSSKNTCWRKLQFERLFGEGWNTEGEISTELDRGRTGCKETGVGGGLRVEEDASRGGRVQPSKCPAKPLIRMEPCVWWH